MVESTAPEEVSDAVARAIEPGGALIVIAYDEAGTAALAAVPAEVPMVAMVEAPAGDEGYGKPWVWLDDRRAALEATRYLLGLGHRTVHYLAIPSSTHTSQRQAGWRTALEEAGAPVPDPVQCGWTPQSGYQAGQALAADPDVTAVLCGNDDLALGLMRAMQEAGRAIPAEHKRRRLRRHASSGIPHPVPHHRAHGLCRTGPGQLRLAPGTPRAGDRRASGPLARSLN